MHTLSPPQPAVPKTARLGESGAVEAHPSTAPCSNPTHDALADFRTARRTQADTDFNDALRFIRASNDLFHNGDTLAENATLDALQAGREAYWSKAIYSNARACRLLHIANDQGLSTALRLVADPESSTHAGRPQYLLGSLIPLNKRAMTALESAWAEWGE